MKNNKLNNKKFNLEIGGSIPYCKKEISFEELKRELENASGGQTSITEVRKNQEIGVFHGTISQANREIAMWEEHGDLPSAIMP